MFNRSGGHTTEMMEILKEINRTNYHPRIYVLANSDITSETKVEQFEDSNKDFEIIKISRSRNVRQSYLSSVFTTLYSIMNCVPILLRFQPELIICNGPGTCVPICLISFLMKLCFINCETKIVFIESFCRVTTLSLSGKILIWIADLFVVQWPKIEKISGKIKYFGRLS